MHVVHIVKFQESDVFVTLKTERDTTSSKLVIRVISFQNELMLQIYSKSVVSAIGKVLRMKFS